MPSTSPKEPVPEPWSFRVCHRLRRRSHGLKSRLVRFMQRVAYDQNILDVYAEALTKGEALLTGPCSQAISRRLAGPLVAAGAHGVTYFGRGTAETLTAP